MRRSLLVAAAVAVLAAPVVASASPTPGAGGRLALVAPGSGQSCTLDPHERVTTQVREHHALSGTWTLAPVLTCSEPELSLTFDLSMRRNGHDVSALHSGGACQSPVLPACTTANGTHRRASYGLSIRGTWTAHAVITLTGPDAFFFPGCAYDATTLSTTCTLDSRPIVIR